MNMTLAIFFCEKMQENQDDLVHFFRQNNAIEGFKEYNHAFLNRVFMISL
jgi:hypothetical protein